jgi:hypothetical protein
VTNLIASLYLLAVTNWMDVTPLTPARGGWEYSQETRSFEYANRRESAGVKKWIGHVRTNTYARVIHGGKTNDVLLSEGEPVLEIIRELTPIVTTTWSTNEVTHVYQPLIWVTNGTVGIRAIAFTNNLFWGANSNR